MARPKKPLAWHLLTNNYRPSRHGSLPQVSASPHEPAPEPHLTGAARYWAFQALPDDVRAWESLLLHGEDWFNQLPPGIDEKKARRMARAKWHEHGRVLVRFWGEQRAHESWAWAQFGDPAGPLKNRGS
jgi:hypothetical protein